MAVGAQTPPLKTTGKGLFTMIGSPPMWQIKGEVSLVFQYHATGQLSNLSHERIDKGPTSTNLLIHIFEAPGSSLEFYATHNV